MKNLDKIAAEYKYYRLDNLPESHKDVAQSYECRNHQEKQTTELVPILDALGLEYGFYVGCYEQNEPGRENYKFFEAGYFLIHAPGKKAVMSPEKSHEKTYRFFLWHKISHSKLKMHKIDAKPQIDAKKPNKIGVPTAKKVTQWLKYIEKQYSAEKCLYNEHFNKQYFYAEYIRAVVDKAKKAGLKVTQREDDQSIETWISTEKTELFISLWKKSNYLNAKFRYLDNRPKNIISDYLKNNGAQI